MKMDFRNIDCMEMMKEFPDNHFDLAIVDPPYGLPKDSTHGRGKLKNRAINQMDMSWDIAPPKEYFEELFRVSKNQIIWGGGITSIYLLQGDLLFGIKSSRFQTLVDVNMLG